MVLIRFWWVSFGHHCIYWIGFLFPFGAESFWKCHRGMSWYGGQIYTHTHTKIEMTHILTHLQLFVIGRVVY